MKAAARAIGARPETVVDDLANEVGNTGAAHWALLLADVLDRAEPGQQIAVVLLADGCDVWLLRATDLLPAHRQAVSVRDRIAATRDDLGVPAVPDVARLPAARAAAPSRARSPGRAAVGPHRRVEVRVRRQPRHERLRLPAAVAGAA